jgi:hypothetical protein
VVPNLRIATACFPWNPPYLTRIAPYYRGNQTINSPNYRPENKHYVSCLKLLFPTTLIFTDERVKPGNIPKRVSISYPEISCLPLLLISCHFYYISSHLLLQRVDISNCKRFYLILSIVSLFSECLCVCPPPPSYERWNQLVAFYEIKYGDHAIENDLQAILSNLVISTISKWQMFKFLRWLNKLH